jgi:hypothetical protein
MTLQGQAAEGTDHGELNPISGSGALHGKQLAGRLLSQLEPGREGDQAGGRGFGIRKVTE